MLKATFPASGYLSALQRLIKSNPNLFLSPFGSRYAQEKYLNLSLRTLCWLPLVLNVVDVLSLLYHFRDLSSV